MDRRPKNAEAPAEAETVDTVEAQLFRLKKMYEEASLRYAVAFLTSDPVAPDDRTVVLAGRLAEVDGCWAPSSVTQAAAALEAVGRLGFTSELRKLLEDKARHSLVKALSSLECTHGSLGHFLSGSGFACRDGTLCLDLLGTFPLSVWVEECLRHPFGLWHLRESLREGRDEFDATVQREWARYGQHIRAYLELFRRNHHPMGLTPASLADTFRSLDADGDWLRATVAELGWRGVVSRGFHEGWRESDLLEVAERSSAWTGELACALAELEDVAEREPTLFGGCCRTAIRCLWTTDQAIAGYVALAWSRQLRLDRLTSPEMANLEAERAATDFVVSLDGSGTVPWMANRLADTPSGHPGERVPWRYLSDKAKQRWHFLVRSRLAGRVAASESFVRYATRWLPQAAYDDVEPLVIELCDNSGSWSLLEKLSQTGPVVSKLRAGTVTDRRSLGRL